MSLWDALRMNMMISYQELVRTFPKKIDIYNDQLSPGLKDINILLAIFIFHCGIANIF
jgi:hypothetical protein